MGPTDSTATEFVTRYHGEFDVVEGSARAWVTSTPEQGPEVIDQARAAGLEHIRTLFQMRVPLPVSPRPESPAIETRPFALGSDEADWVRVNNEAFSWHPDQGSQTVETLRSSMTEPWFDLDGFRILELDGEMAGFCWTKVHSDHHPVLGEIYVIAVANRFAGRGLGRALTLAGLDYLATERSTPVGMLYVEADNTAAIRTYKRIGFDVHLTRLGFVTGDDARH